MEDVWKRAPERATHYIPQKCEFTSEVFLEVVGDFIKTAWVSIDDDELILDPNMDKDYHRFDYFSKGECRLDMNYAIERPQETDFTLAGWLLNGAYEYDGHKQTSIGPITLKQLKGVVYQLEKESKGYSFYIELYSDNSGSVLQEGYWSDGEHPSGHRNRTIFSFVLVED